jgi:hypothetical protein
MHLLLTEMSGERFVLNSPVDLLKAILKTIKIKEL